jgi:arylsulfatase A-like enzyme
MASDLDRADLRRAAVRTVVFGLAAALGLAACGSEPAPVWVALARGFEPRSLELQVAAWERAAPEPTGTTCWPLSPGASLSHVVAPGAWQPAEVPGCLAAPLPHGAFRASGAEARLVGRGREYGRVDAAAIPAPGEFRVEEERLTLRVTADVKRAPPTVLVFARANGVRTQLPLPPSAWRTGDLASSFWLPLPKHAEGLDPAAMQLFAELVRVDEERALAPFEYRVEGERVLLCWPDGAPPLTELAARLENGRAVDGQWQVRLGRFCGAAIPVWSGEREELESDLAPGSELSFRFVHGARTGEVRARIALDGETLFERVFAPGSCAEPQPFRIPLPRAGRARFAFEIEGPPGQGVFFTPTLGPRAKGTPLARPWRARPDLVLFLADTLRADALALHGGDPALAPNLNRFAEQSLRFPRARSNAAWTLPSIGSILTGLHPGQHCATDEDLVLPASHVTLPERLERAGYRTGAITDGSFFAPIFGLDQGFEWFAQHDPPRWDLDRTIAEAQAFLEHDDGRAVFLVVHTYRTHQPYRVGPDEDRGPYDALLSRVRLATGTDSPGPAAGRDALVEVQAELRELYGQGVRDLDRGFGAFLAWLESRRFFEHGTLVFTSDHGEALGENHDFFHGGHLWETKLAVPLLVRGAGIVPRAAAHLAGPLDLAPTFAELARIPPDPGWVGTSLLGLDRERPAFAFQLGARSRQAAFLDDTRKVILTPDEARLASGSCEEAFDLANDPLEAHNLARSAGWPAELTRRLAPAARGYLEARGETERAGVSSELREQLDDLGYGGDEE